MTLPAEERAAVRKARKKAAKRRYAETRETVKGFRKAYRGAVTEAEKVDLCDQMAAKLDWIEGVGRTK